MFCPCMYLIAQPSSAIQNLTASSVNVFLDMWNRRSPPLIRSTTRYLVAASQPCVAGGTVPAARRTLHVLNVLEAVAQVANERVVHVLEHSSLSDDVADAFGSDDWGLSQSCRRNRTKHMAKPVQVGDGAWVIHGAPSSFRMYFSANDSPVSFRSTMRTFPKAPRPTTRRRRK